MEQKRPHAALESATQGLSFLDFLGFSQDAQMCLFRAVRGCVRFPKTIQLLPLVLETYILNNFVWMIFAPILLIILIIHIIIAIRWMLIKIFSTVIKCHGGCKAIILGGCCLGGSIRH